MRIKYEKDYKRQKEVAQHNAKLASIGELAAGVGHEINNPLAIVKGYISRISKEVERGDSLDSIAVLSNLKKMNIAVDRMARIVKGLRTFSRQETLEETDFYPSEAIKETFEMINELFKKDGITLIFVNPVEYEDVIVKGNLGSFQQVLMNLIFNAKDAVSGCQTREIETTLSFQNSWLQIAVKDSGGGIPEDLMEKVFDPFFTTKEVNKGVGIGLSLVRNFVMEMGGSIGVNSRLGEGATFLVDLPARKNIQGREVKTIGEKRQSPSLKRGRAIVADDEDDLREILSETLTEVGIQVESVENGKLAYELYCKNPDDFDLILSDAKMPEMDGLTLFKKIRFQQKIKQPKLILITGDRSKSEIEIEAEANFRVDGYLCKPFGEKQILEVLSSCLSDNFHDDAA